MKSNFNQSDCIKSSFNQLDWIMSNFNQLDCNSYNFNQLDCIKSNFNQSDVSSLISTNQIVLSLISTNQIKSSLILPKGTVRVISSESLRKNDMCPIYLIKRFVWGSMNYISMFLFYLWFFSKCISCLLEIMEKLTEIKPFESENRRFLPHFNKIYINA